MSFAFQRYIIGNVFNAHLALLERAIAVALLSVCPSVSLSVKRVIFTGGGGQKWEIWPRFSTQSPLTRSVIPMRERIHLLAIIFDNGFSHEYILMKRIPARYSFIVRTYCTSKLNPITGSL